MYTYIKNLKKSTLFLEQLPIFGASFLISELFYKFGSFALELCAFLITWYAFDLSLNFVKSLFYKTSNVSVSVNK